MREIVFCLECSNLEITNFEIFFRSYSQYSQRESRKIKYLEFRIFHLKNLVLKHSTVYYNVWIAFCFYIALNFGGVLLW